MQGTHVADGVTWWPLITEAKTMMSALIMGLGDHGDLVDDAEKIQATMPADFHD